MKSCRCCGGTGREIDQQALAVEMRKLRLASGKKLRHVAMAMGISAPYLVDLEFGRRDWPDKRVEDFRRICNGKSK